METAAEPCVIFWLKTSVPLKKTVKDITDKKINLHKNACCNRTCWKMARHVSVFDKMHKSAFMQHLNSDGESDVLNKTASTQRYQ